MNENKTLTIEPGAHIWYNDIEFVLLDITAEGDYFAVSTEIAMNARFNDKLTERANNWEKSSLRAFLNSTYLDKYFKREHLVKTVTDMVTDYGDRTYGTCEDYITLLTCDQRRKYFGIAPLYDDWTWTPTPWYIPNSPNAGHALAVRLVAPSGAWRTSHATIANGVAPACVFNHKILTPHRQAQSDQIVLEEIADE
jgi:hypothetical protein